MVSLSTFFEKPSILLDSFSYVILLCCHYLFRSRTSGRQIVCSLQTRITHSNWLVESMCMRPILGLRVGLRPVTNMTFSEERHGMLVSRGLLPVLLMICTPLWAKK